MSTGKAAARDTRYGRRGGNWIDDTPMFRDVLPPDMGDADIATALLDIASGAAGGKLRSLTAEQRFGVITEAAMRLRARRS